MAKLDKPRWARLQAIVEAHVRDLRLAAEQLRELADDGRLSKANRLLLNQHADRFEAAAQALWVEVRSGPPQLGFIRAWCTPVRMVAVVLLPILNGSLENVGVRVNDVVSQIVTRDAAIEGEISMLESDVTLEVESIDARSATIGLNLDGDLVEEDAQGRQRPLNPRWDQSRWT